MIEDKRILEAIRKVEILWEERAEGKEEKKRSLSWGELEERRKKTGE